MCVCVELYVAGGIRIFLDWIQSVRYKGMAQFAGDITLLAFGKMSSQIWRA